MKLVSIVLPTFNGEKFIRHSIESVINQSYKNWELIIVNDCSSDSTGLIIEEYKKIDKRIKIITNETNKKLPESLNIGFKAAQGSYLTWTSDDNIYKENAIQYMVEFLDKNPEIDLVSCDFDFVNEDGIFQCRFIDRVKNRLPLQLVRQSNIGACFLYKKEIAEKTGDYAPEMFCAEDYDYWCRIAIHGNIAYSNENLYQYRNNSNSLTATKQDTIRRKTQIIKNIYKKELIRKYKNRYKYFYLSKILIPQFLSFFYSKEKFENKAIFRILGIKITIKKQIKVFKLSEIILPENIKNWINYYEKNNIGKKLETLTRGLKESDLKTIHTNLKRHKFFMSNYDYANLCYLKYEELLTKQEKEQAQNINIEKYRRCFPVKFYEPSVLYYHCGLKFIPFCKNYIKDKDFIDGGACIGDSALIFEKNYNPKCVYAFEPLKENLEYLNKTIKMNRLKNVKPVEFGLGSKEEEAIIFYNPDNIGGSSIAIQPDVNKKQKITITTIDDFTNRNNLNLGLIKLDTEGFESNIIRGAKKSIEKYRPVMLISIYHTPEDFFEIKPVIEEMNLNYKFKIEKCAPSSLCYEIMLIAYPAELENN